MLSYEQKSIITSTYFTLAVLFALSIGLYFILKSNKDKIDEKTVDKTTFSSLGIFIASAIIYALLSFFSKYGKKYTFSMKILYYIFLISSILLVSFTSLKFSEDNIESALYVTLAIFFIMTMVGFAMINSGIQFNTSYSIVSLLLLVLLIIAIFMGVTLKNTEDKEKRRTSAIYMAILFMFVLLISFDTWYFVSSKEVLKWTTDMRYQQAVMNIWLDIINIFTGASNLIA